MHAGFTVTHGNTRPRWRVVSARMLNDEEKGDKHHVYIELRDQAGADARGITGIRSGWEGMEGSPETTPTDKQPPEPACNIPIFEGEQRWIEVDAGTAESDRVSGMDAYHAYEVIFQYDDGNSQLPDPTTSRNLKPFVPADTDVIRSAIATTDETPDTWTEEETENA